MKKLSEVFWGLIGLAAVAVSCYLLWGQLKTLSWASIEAAFAAIPLHHFLFAAVSTLVAYAALAWYDRIEVAIGDARYRLPATIGPVQRP